MARGKFVISTYFFITYFANKEEKKNKRIRRKLSSNITRLISFLDATASSSSSSSTSK